MELHFSQSDENVYPQGYYIAFDGKRFVNSQDCQRYEYATRKRLLKDVEMCEEMNNMPPFNPAVFAKNKEMAYRNFYWYKPNTIQQISQLENVYGIDIEIEPKNWVCIEVNQYACCYYRLSDALAYVRECLTKLGMLHTKPEQSDRPITYGPPRRY